MSGRWGRDDGSARWEDGGCGSESDWWLAKGIVSSSVSANGWNWDSASQGCDIERRKALDRDDPDARASRVLQATLISRWAASRCRRRLPTGPKRRVRPPASTAPANSGKPPSPDRP